MQTGTSIPPARSRRTTETPSRSGIVTSRTMTAGGWRATASSASLPPAAVATAKPSRRSARSRACRTEASSSTTRTRGSGVAMRSELLERGLDLGRVDVQPGGQLRREGVLELPVVRLVARAQLVEGALDLARAQAELLRERGGHLVVALGAALALERAERLLELRLGDADRLGEIGGAVRAAAVALERLLDLGGAHAELRGQRLGDIGVLSALAARRAELLQRRIELGPGDPEGGREAGQLVAAVEGGPGL